MLTLISAMQLKKPEISLWNFNLHLDRSSYPWSDLRGRGDLLAKIQNQILFPLKQHLLTSASSSSSSSSKAPHLFPSSKTILLHGIANSGKTLVAKTLGAELKRVYWDTQWTNLQAYYISALDMVSGSEDETKNKMSRIFQRIQQLSMEDNSPAYVIIDDLDKLLSSSGASTALANLYECLGGSSDSSTATVSNTPPTPGGNSGSSGGSSINVQSQNIGNAGEFQKSLVIHQQRDLMLLDHLKSCIDHVKNSTSGHRIPGYSRAGQGQGQGHGQKPTTFIVLVMNSNTSSLINVGQIQTIFNLDMSLALYAMDKDGRHNFLQTAASALNQNSNPVTGQPEFSQMLEFLVQNTLGFTAGDLVKLKNLAIVQAGAAAAKRMISNNNRGNNSRISGIFGQIARARSRSKAKSGLGDQVDPEDWLRALHHFHSHEHCTNYLENVVLTPGHQVKMSMVTSFQILTCPSVIDPLVRENVQAITNLVRSKIRIQEHILMGSGSRSSTGQMLGTMNSSSAGIIMNPEEPPFLEDPNLPFGNSLPMFNRLLYLWQPPSRTQVRGQGQGQTQGQSEVSMNIEFLNKYVVPLIVTRNFPHLPTFVIHGESVISQNIPPYIIFNMLREVRQFEGPCFLIITSLHLLTSRFRGDLLNRFSSELSKCTNNCGPSRFIFTIVTSTLDVSKLTSGLQDIFHGGQNCYRVQNIGEEEIRDFLGQAIFDPVTINLNLNLSLSPIQTQSAGLGPDLGPCSELDPENDPQNSPTLVMFRNKHSQHADDPCNVNNSEHSYNPNSKGSQSKVSQKFPEPPATSSKTHCRNIPSVVQPRRETPRRKLAGQRNSKNNNNDRDNNSQGASTSTGRKGDDEDNQDQESPSNKRNRLDPNQILDRAVSIALRMNPKSIIWLYEDLMRVNRAGGEDMLRILSYQEQIVSEAEEPYKASVVSRKSSKNLSASVIHSNNKRNSKASLHTKASSSMSALTKNTRNSALPPCEGDTSLSINPEDDRDWVDFCE